MMFGYTDTGNENPDLLSILMGILLGCLACLLISILASCARTEYVSVPTVQREYVTRVDTAHVRDSVYVTDSIMIMMKGDTVFNTRIRTQYKLQYIYKVLADTVVKTDSVSVPYPVERKLTAWERVKDRTFVPVLSAAVIAILLFVWYVRRRFV